MSNRDFALITALAAVRERMIAHSESLRSSAAVASAESRLDVREYAAGDLRIDAYVDAELADGRAVTWWLEARLEGNTWIVECLKELRKSTWLFFYGLQFGAEAVVPFYVDLISLLAEEFEDVRVFAKSYLKLAETRNLSPNTIELIRNTWVHLDAQ